MASQSNSSKNSFVNLKIISFNARGLRSNKKRRTLFYLFKKNKYDIISNQNVFIGNVNQLSKITNVKCVTASV